MDKGLETAVEEVIVAAMEAVMDKVLHQDPFDMEKRRRIAPLHTALVPEDIFKGSHFERRFVTPFGKVARDHGRMSASTATYMCLNQRHRRVSLLSSKHRCRTVTKPK